MRNLKRALSLALASVMLLGMMVVGTSAASYPDVDSNDYVEAIEILNAAEVMIGDDQGNFNPDKVVTRAEMSVIISKLLYGTDLSVASFADVETFSDVPAWAQGYVNLCASLGIVAGVGDGKFDPNATVTTAQAALMLLRALDIDVVINANTDYKVAAMTAAEDADLFEDMGILAANAGLTRNNVAQMALNAMLYNDSEDIYVVTNGTSTYEFDDAKDALLYKALLGEGWNVYTTKDYSGSLIDEVFEITVSDGADAYGRPATVYAHDDWAADKAYPETPDYAYVIEGDTNLYDLVKDNSLTKKINVDADAFKAVELQNSKVVELYVDSDKNLTSVITYSYVLGEITDVDTCDEDDHEDAIDDGAKYVLTIKFDGKKLELFDINIANFNKDTYVEGAMITWTGAVSAYDFENMDDEYDYVMVDTAIADEVDGKITATGTDYVRINGVKYTAAASFDGTLSKNDEGTFYLDPNGFVLGFAETEETTDISDVIYVIDTYSKSSTDDYGKTTKTTYAQVMHLDGEIENLVVYIDGDDDYGTTVGIKNGNLYTYSTYTAKKVVDGINYKGTSKLTAWAGDDEDYFVGTIAKDYEIESGDTKATASIEGKNYVRLNKGTNYIMIDGSLSDVEVAVHEGGVNTTVAQTATVIATKSGTNYVAKYVILPGSEVSATSYDDVIYIAADADFESITVADTECISFEYYTEDGKLAAYEKWIPVDTDELPDAGFYTYSIDEDGIYELTEVKDIELTSNYDDEAGVISGSFDSVYEDLLTLNKQYLVDIDASKAAIIDLHDDDVYDDAIKSLDDMVDAYDDGYTIDLVIYADDGAVMIVVTNVTKAA